MNEKIDLTKILKDCPEGTKLYSIAYGDVEFDKIAESKEYPINIRVDDYHIGSLTADGQIYANTNGECALFPSKDQRDWSKFTAPWLKKDKFDPKTLKPYDKVLVWDNKGEFWCCDLFSNIKKGETDYPYLCVGGTFEYCIPYNDETKHLVGTNEDAPEYYRYWED